MTYADEVLADSPAVFLTFDEATGNFLDASGNSNDFTPGAGVTRSKAGLVSDGGSSVSGSGTNLVASRGSLASGMGGSTGTLEAWVRIPAANVKGAFASVGQNSLNGWMMGVGSGDANTAGKHLIYARVGLAWHDTGATLTDGIRHVVITRNGSTFTWFVDGAQVGTAAPGAPNAAAAEMKIGQSGSGDILSSGVDIDNVAIYPSALSSTRIAAHYAAGIATASALSLDATLPTLTEAIVLRTYVATSMRNRVNGRRREGYALVADNTDPVTLPVDRTERRDKALWYPTPTLVEGRPIGGAPPPDAPVGAPYPSSSTFPSSSLYPEDESA